MFRLQEQEILVAMGTDSSRRAVSKLDFETRKNREFQKSSRGVNIKALTPLSQQPKFFALSGKFIRYFLYRMSYYLYTLKN
jgi:hypothetical protein